MVFRMEIMIPLIAQGKFGVLNEFEEQWDL